MESQYAIYYNILLSLYLYLLGSFAGYAIEVLYRRYVSVKRWVNPGFMKGPWIPLYGFGVLFMYWIIHLFREGLANIGIGLYNPYGRYLNYIEHSPTFYDLLPILVMGLGMTILEFFAGIIFVKGFKVRLWDYTNDRGNIMGIICPRFSIIWLLVSVLFYYALAPFISYFAYDNASDILGGLQNGEISKIWIIFLLGIVYGIMILDFLSSIKLFNKVTAFARKIGEIVHYEDLIANNQIFRKQAREQFTSLIPETVKENLERRKNKDFKNTIRYKIKTILYIDPDKENNASNNFDANGRPICEENSDDSIKK
jgi:uncharacterized membrane protein